MTMLEVVHTTTYRYASPVTFGEHRAMLRPRDSHQLKLRSATMKVTPAASVRWLYDVFGNSVTLLEFAAPAATLTVESRLELQQFSLEMPDYRVAAAAESWPFDYSADELADLGRTREMHTTDPDDRLAAWAMGFTGGSPTPTLELLAAMTKGIKAQLTYAARDDEGTRHPLDTLDLGTGTCRDYAYLMIEAVRSLGFGARFVTGYLYDPAADGGPTGLQGAGASHAWAEVFVPGAGWLEFDPTNGIVGSRNLIRVAVVREPGQAVPLAGSWTGAPGDFLGMSVAVTVRRLGPAAG